MMDAEDEIRPVAKVAPGRLHLRMAGADDLAALNAVIGHAVMTWHLPERVKRLSLPTYLYHPHDLEYLHIVLAVAARQTIIGVAAWEPANSRDVPAGQRGLLLHGLYVDPMRQKQGVGSRLLAAALAAAREQGFDGLLVKAQPDAEGFFAAHRMRRLMVKDPTRDYPNRFWQQTR